MLIADVHAHLDYYKTENRVAEVVKSAESAGVKVIITNGTTPETNRKSLKFAEEFKIVNAALGLHPEFIRQFSDSQIDSELHFIEENRNKIVAVGEIGLDFHWIKEEAERHRQRLLFEKELELAQRIKKPVIVHTREAEKECMDILSSYSNQKVILHCFSGSKNLLKRGFDLGFMFSIPTNIVRSKHFQEMAKQLPLSRILTETDSPFLSPHPGRENEPAFITETIGKVAEIKGMDKEEVAKILYSNYQRVFI
ncbi:MAG: TatD family hydrolase [Candidatus Woesearchaeota archaeon]